MIHNVCRLCLGTQDLMWIFNTKMADNMPEIIQVTSGVEITKNDAITQMVCSTCCQITIKMFKFRTTSIKNDKDLKAKCIGLNIDPVINSPAVKKESPVSIVPVTSPSTKAKVMLNNKNNLATIRITTATASTPSTENKLVVSGSSSASRSSTPAIPHSVKIPINQRYKCAHPSIKKLAETYPNIKLPQKLPLNSHVDAYITLQADEVDEWYKEKNYSGNDINKIKKAAVDYAIRFEKNQQKKRGRKRKMSIESTSSTASKRSTNTDKSVSLQSSIKGVKLNSEVSIKTVISPAAKPSVEPKIHFSKSETRHHVNTNNCAPIKSKADTTVKSTETAKANTNIESEEKQRLTKQFDNRPGHRRIIKPISDSESDITDTSETNVKSNVTLTMDSNGFISSIKARSDHNIDKTYDGSARTRRNSTTNGKINVQPNVSSTTKPSESIASESGSNITMSSTLQLLLAGQNTSNTDATEISLRSLLQSSKSRTTNKRNTTERNYSGLGSDSDADDPIYDPGDDDYHCDSDGEKGAEEPISSTNKKSSNSSRQNSSDKPQQRSSNGLQQCYSDAIQQKSSDEQQKSSSNVLQQKSSDEQQQSSSDALQQKSTDEQQQSSSDALQQKSTDGQQLNSSDALQQKSSEVPQQNSSNTPQQMTSDLSQQNPSNEPQEEKKEEYSLFTTRPFVKNAEERRKRQLKYKQRLTEGDNKCELLVLTDTDSEDDLMIVPVSENGDTTDKSTFVNSLQLTPKDSSNEPDLSLVSVTAKTSTLHICNICDSHHSSQKELKIHQRKTHTKCPICNRRFRSLATRDKHKYTCIANNSPYELKTIILQLKRVDEIEEIRNRYPNAFETLNEHDYCINRDKAPPTPSNADEVLIQIGAVGSVPPQLELDTAGSSVNLDEMNINDTPIDTAVKELEKFLQNAQSSSLIKKDNANSRKSTDEAESIKENVPGGDDIICISDDEGDKVGAKNVRNIKRPKLSVVNHDILKGINTQDSDINILKKIIIEAKARKVSKNYNLMKANENIIDGSSPKVKIFKNLRKHLQSYTIPVEISYSPTLCVDYKYRESTPVRKVTDLWYTMPCQDFKYSSQKPSLYVSPSSKQTTNALHFPKQPLQNSLKPNTSAENLSPSPKQSVNILPSYTLATQQLRVSAPNSINPNGLLLQALANSASQSVIRQPNIFQTNGKDVQGQLVQISAAQDTSVGATRTMNYTSSSIINTCNIPKYTSPQMFIGSSTNLSTSTNSYIIVAPMKTSNDNMNIPNLAPLPVIQSVSSGQEVVGTVCNTDAYRPHSNETTVQQPSIRVKNLSELS